MKSNVNISKKVNLYYSIFISIFTFIMGIIFILTISNIYYTGLESGKQIYTPEIVSSNLSPLIIPIIIWILSITGGFIISILFKVEDKPKLKFSSIDQVNKYYSMLDDDYKNDENYFLIKKEKALQYLAKIISLAISILCAIICSLYLFNINNFNKDGDLLKQATDMIKFILPFFLMSIFSCILAITFNLISAKNELTIIKKIFPKYKKEMSFKNNISRKKLLIIRLSILVISICFIVLGIFNESMRSVFIKAVNLCTECIGLG